MIKRMNIKMLEMINEEEKSENTVRKNINVSHQDMSCFRVFIRQIAEEIDGEIITVMFISKETNTRRKESLLHQTIIYVHLVFFHRYYTH